MDTNYNDIDKAYIVSSIDKLNEPYLPFPTIHKNQILGQQITDTITNGFNIRAMRYFYFNSTNKDRVLYTKAGNMVLQNMVCFTEYLSNQIEDIEDGEVINIYYGN